MDDNTAANTNSAAGTSGDTSNAGTGPAPTRAMMALLWIGAACATISSLIFLMVDRFEMVSIALLLLAGTQVSIAMGHRRAGRQGE